jgi:hypothetical protein
MKSMIALLLFVCSLEAAPKPPQHPDPMNASSEDKKSFLFIERITKYYEKDNPYYIAIGLADDKRVTRPYSFVGARLSSGYLGSNFPDGIWACYTENGKAMMQLMPAGFDAYAPKATTTKIPAFQIPMFQTPCANGQCPTK